MLQHLLHDAWGAEASLGGAFSSHALSGEGGVLYNPWKIKQALKGRHPRLHTFHIYIFCRIAVLIYTCIHQWRRMMVMMRMRARRLGEQPIHSHTHAAFKEKGRQLWHPFMSNVVLKSFQSQLHLMETFDTSRGKVAGSHDKKAVE